MHNGKKIIIAGYPKSGNTWLTRLISELTESPAKGFLGSDKSDEYSIVNKGFKSKYSVFKSHYTYPEIMERYKGARVICIVRDVRDIAISASHNFNSRFNIAPDNLLGDIMQMNKVAYKVYDKAYGNRIRISKMIHVLKFGRYDMRWCRIPWDIHIASFLESNALIVKYENLLNQPMLECKKILDHLYIEKSQDFIRQAYYRQSFEVTKQLAKRQGDQAHEKFLRKGKSGDWRKTLTIHQKNKLFILFKKTLEELQYA
jgi:hypothetical protein